MYQGIYQEYPLITNPLFDNKPPLIPPPPSSPTYLAVRAARPRNEDNVLVLRTVSLPYFPTYLEARNRRVGKVSPLPCYPAPAPQLGP